ncbi:MAG: sigma-54 dependent transcriptional regulator [Porticoccaceae bacterium]|jgi:DNA-binding NtrC family response regulator|nr:sigma-54 dependent transcriptional regulator [Porticoccaceae bacterium]MEA3298760.1 sigma-54 dependent transcriptional regulator [Pseudomonadota bacterium]HLS99074.1 sigma-54 dependent transcriptional regulator [Porticoccaceae bacterium]
MQRILIVEDEEVIRNSLVKLLERNGYAPEAAANIQDATQRYALADFDLIISDLRLPGAPGTDLIKMAGEVPVLIMTSYASLRSAVDTMKMGAVDYIPKPFDQKEVLSSIKRIFSMQSTAKQFHSPTHASRGMIGNSAPMKEVFNIIHKVAPTDATVLIQGETGTGKELAAKAIHNESRRAKNPIICVNCAAIPDTLIEAELFGHEKGAFTGAHESRTGLVAAADGGTLFLDEIGELPLEAQARLLRVLQEGEVRPIGSVKSRDVDVRLVAATHRNLQKLCKEGLFREDLYYRINVVNLHIPPLRERGKDILELAEYLLAKFSAKLGKPSMTLAPDAIQAITTYTWPGNIREMENSIQRAVILCDEDHPITHDLLGIDLALVEIDDDGDSLQGDDAPVARRLMDSDTPEGLSLEDYFTRFVLENQHAMSETELARKLGISRKCLWERRQKLGIPRAKTA